jgi:hypothetical protein
MTAITPAAFDPKPRQLGAVIDCVAGAAILAGAAVVIEGSGDNFTVIPCDSDTAATLPFIGVALYSAAADGDHVAVASTGSVVMVQEGDGSAGIDAGDFLQAGSASGSVVVETNADLAILGLALTDCAAGGFTYCLVQPQLSTKGA